MPRTARRTYYIEESGPNVLRGCNTYASSTRGCPQFIEFEGDKKSAVRNIVKPYGKLSSHFAFTLHRARAIVVHMPGCFQFVEELWSCCVICRSALSCESTRGGPATGECSRQYAFSRSMKSRCSGTPTAGLTVRFL